MSPGKVKMPKAIKFIYRNKEILWLKVDNLKITTMTVMLTASQYQKVLHTINMSKYTKSKWWKQNIDFIFVFV